MKYQFIIQGENEEHLSRLRQKICKSKTFDDARSAMNISPISQYKSRLKEIETIYEIADAQDDNYENWFGTQEDIVDYLRENKEHIEGYNEGDGFIKNLERYKLTFKIIN